MGNRWHATQDKNMRPDIAFNSCPWCGSDSICVDTTKFEHEHLNTWTAQAWCHECGAKSPDSDFDAEHDSHLYHQKQYLDIEVERDVVNQAVRVWSHRIYLDRIRAI